MSHTIRYKQGYIHYSIRDGVESVYVQVMPMGHTKKVKSIQAAKTLITRSARGAK